MLEIERKFLIKELPDLTHMQPIHYERYFVINTSNQHVRVQKKGNRFELETKVKINELEFHKDKQEISKAYFLELSHNCNKAIVRDSYLIHKNPNITIKKYFDDYEGLIRAEIEYDNMEQINTFVLPDWLGKEITGTELANDNKLITLDRNKFLKKLQFYQDKN